MSTISDAEEAKKKRELDAICNESRLKCIRFGILRVNCMLVRAQAQDLRAHNRNLRAVRKEWFIK
jgi:hypothetical protein